MSHTTPTLDPRLQRYLLDALPAEPESLRQLREATDQRPDAVMRISPEQGRFLALLVQLSNARRVVEVGTFTGYSALWMALSLPPEGQLVTCDNNPHTAAIAGEAFRRAGMAGRISQRLGPARHSLAQLAQETEWRGQTDLLFIDADKPSYPDYWRLGLPLLRPGGLVVVDNAFWDGAVADPAQAGDPQVAGIREVTRLARETPGTSMALLPLGDGVLLARVAGPTATGIPCPTPGKGPSC